MPKRKQASTPKADRDSAASAAVIAKPGGTLASSLVASNGVSIRTEASSDDSPLGADTETAESKRLSIANALSTIVRAFVDERDPNVKPALSLCFAAGTIAMGQAYDAADLDSPSRNSAVRALACEAA